MKKLGSLFIMFFLIQSAWAQIQKGTGILYFDDRTDLQAYAPNESFGSEVAVTLDSSLVFKYDRIISTWVELGDVHTIAQMISDSLSTIATGSSDTNMAEDNLTLDANRLHDLNGFDWRLKDGELGISVNNYNDQLLLHNYFHYIDFNTDYINIKRRNTLVPELRFYDYLGSNYIGFRAPDVVGDTVVYTLSEDGDVNQVQTTDGNGNLSWRNATIVVDSFQQIQNINAEVGQYIYSVEQDAYYTVSQDSFLRPLDNIYQFKTSEGDFVNIVPKDGKLTARSYGIVGDVKQISGAGTNTGNVLTSSVPVFTSNDVGKIINIDGAYHQGTYQTETLTLAGTSTADQTISFDYINIDVDILNGDIVDTIAAKVQRAIDESEYFAATRSINEVVITYTKMYPERFVTANTYTGGSWTKSNEVRGVARKTFSTTIANVNSSTQATLTDTPYLDVSNADFEFGTNQTEKAKLFIDYCTEHRYVSYFNEGIYYFSESTIDQSTCIEIQKDYTHIEGVGQQKTIFKFSSPSSMDLYPESGTGNWIIADSSYHHDGTPHDSGGKRYLRMFHVQGANNVKIDGITFDGYNEVMKYRSSGGVGWKYESGTLVDAQQYFIQSQDASFCNYSNLEIINICGDAITTPGGTHTYIEGITIRDFLRQGVGVGGSNTKYIYVSNIYKHENQNILRNGGTDFHSEPNNATQNLYLENIHIDIGTAGYSYDGIMINVSANIFTANHSKKITMLNCSIGKLNLGGANDFITLEGNTIGTLNATSSTDTFDLNINNCIIEDGIDLANIRNVNIAQTKILFDWDDAGTVKNLNLNRVKFQYFRWTGLVALRTNINITNSQFERVNFNGCAEVNLINSSVIYDSDYPVIVSNSFGNTILKGNVIECTSNAIYYYATQNDIKYTYQMFLFDNRIKTTGGAHLKLYNLSALIRDNIYYKNDIESEIIITYVNQLGNELVPLNYSNGRKFYGGNTLPVHGGLYKKGDISQTDLGTFVVTQEGGAYKEDWDASNTYYNNEFVRGSNNRVYRCVQYNGNAEDPTLDADDSHWIEVATDTVVWEKIITDSDKIQYQSNATAAQTVIDVGQSFNPNKSTWTLKINGLEYNEGLTNSQISSYDAAAGTITLFAGLAADDTIIFRGQKE